MINQAIKVAVDAVVFGYRNQKLEILLINQAFDTARKQWALPGGLVKNDESLDAALKRELFEETNIQVSFSEQLYTYGRVDRDHRNRVISVAYLNLVKPQAFLIKAGSDADKVQWFTVEDIPKLAFDHNEIVKDGLNRLRSKVFYQPIGFDLLDAKFPLSDLEQLYQTLLGEKIDRRNFRKKIQKFGFIQQLDEWQQNPCGGRPAQLFQFRADVYQNLVKSGFVFDIKLT